jgi:glycosyltransferase involved in cell wall biosynthesis
VDNEYFREKTENLKDEKLKIESREKYGLPERYFLASARFVSKKNLSGLLKAYALYRQKAESEKQKVIVKYQTSVPSPQSSVLGPRASDLWSLVLLGDGPLKSDLCRLISDLGLRHCVLLPGFKQYSELPVYYSLASVFVHASTTEQWGLVVNEAMASGLPVLVSDRCGCAQDLVQEGNNGFTFDPYNVKQLAQLMLEISGFQPFRLSAFGNASREIISNWGPERFASGLQKAVETALNLPPRRPSPIDRLLLRLLLFR